MLLGIPDFKPFFAFCFLTLVPKVFSFLFFSFLLYYVLCFCYVYYYVFIEIEYVLFVRQEKSFLFQHYLFMSLLFCFNYSFLIQKV